MDLSQQFLIDMALNVGGYLLAGALGIVIYSMFRRRKPAVAAVDERTGVDVESAEPTPVKENPTRKLEFIKLGTGPTSTPTAARQVTESRSERRDRADIIRVARTMLKAGATHDKIKRVIPVSDAELSLLSMSKS